MTPDPGLDAVLRHLKEERGSDFTGYKRASLERRVRRRMQTVGVETYDAYLDRLMLDQAEFAALFDTLLINVTSFFRDAEAWAYLTERLVPDILDRAPTGPLRFWSAGCASGQEPFSLAIVLAQALGHDQLRDRVKIYATDIDEASLDQARRAVFTDREVASLPASATHYLEPSDESGRYRLRGEVRRAVIFGRNDLVQDAPISHVDLLLCRNTLMYFDAETQAKVLRRFHFALQPQGVLFLGKAEMLLSRSATFGPLDMKRRFFRKVDDGRGRTSGRFADSVALPAPRGPGVDVIAAAVQSSPLAQLVVDVQGRLALANHRAETLFGLSARDLGSVLQDLQLSYRPGELRSLVEQAARERRTVWQRDVHHVRGLGREASRYDVQAVPLFDGEQAPIGVTVVFEDVTHQLQLQEELEHANTHLSNAYEELQSTNEELETTNEELQSTVEELETTNEELQSTNEELETMNEELQSMNDELQSMNDELRGRTDEVAALNDFMSTVLSSLQAGVAVVDRDLTVTAWNSRAQEMWGLRPEEAVGQNILALDIGLPLERIRARLRRQLRHPDDEAGDGDAAAEPDLDAVNRRGRPVRVRVTVSPLVDGSEVPVGAIVMMDEA